MVHLETGPGTDQTLVPYGSIVFNCVIVWCSCVSGIMVGVCREVHDGSSQHCRPWPEGLKTSCLYRSSDASWVLGGGARLTCVLHVNSLALETRAGTWNQNFPDQQLHVA